MVDIALVINKKNDLCEVCLLQDRRIDFAFLPSSIVDHIQVGKKYVVRHNNLGRIEFAVKGGFVYG